MTLLASDYDDTFDKYIDKNINQVNEFMKNNLFVIATGRSYLDFKRAQDLYNIRCNYIIINHGASIVKNGIDIYNVYIDDLVKDKIIDDLNSCKIIEKIAYSKLDSNVDFNKNSLTKIHIKCIDVISAEKLYDLLLNKYSEYINIYFVGHGKSLEIVSKNVDKSVAIKYVAEKEKINLKNIYTIGNGYSDIQMIKCFNGFAVTNAIEEIKRNCIKEYNGVYELIENIIETRSNN
ncbi:MAG: Cof-type HAD-IIB family hydrolase [Clostridium sp.]|nr:Cof-type HAD-IIB family hydrolase [Clostridium sp.]MCM1444611.1 Cof-type HAD-IIB family hydrolase [Candidatus Amulumruptor caecigallinarius]